VINPAVDALAAQVGIARACALLGRSRAGHYRARRPVMLGPAPRRPAASNALSESERAHVLTVLTSDQFVDKSVAQVWATLLDEGTYLCSQSSMHRILRANRAAGERRSQAVHPARAIPELLATRAGQVWSWDIERHEALLNPAVVKGHRWRPVAAGRLKLRTAWSPGWG
jgi:putative transposase